MHNKIKYFITKLKKIFFSLKPIKRKAFFLIILIVDIVFISIILFYPSINEYVFGILVTIFSGLLTFFSYKRLVDINPKQNLIKIIIILMLLFVSIIYLNISEYKVSLVKEQMKTCITNMIIQKNSIGEASISYKDKNIKKYCDLLKIDKTDIYKNDDNTLKVIVYLFMIFLIFSRSYGFKKKIKKEENRLVLLEKDIRTQEAENKK